MISPGMNIFTLHGPQLFHFSCTWLETEGGDPMGPMPFNRGEYRQK